MSSPAALPPHLPLLAALADELARSGVQHAVVCPGSRNAAVLLALQADPRITCWSAVDERSAGFFALGIAKATGTPAAVSVTSGTAVSNLLPAATEAREAGVPLLLLTADRPPELRDVGAGQTIDQLRALHGVCRWVVEADLNAASVERERWVRATVCRAVAATVGPKPGPVQINLPLREPLTAPGPHGPLTAGRPGGQPWLAVEPAAGIEPSALARLATRCMHADRGVIVAGRSERSPELATLLPRLANILDWPLLADPMSGARRGRHAVAEYDLFAGREPGQALVPDLVLRVGDLPVSKPLRRWLATTAAEAPQLMLTPEAVWSDPDSAASEWLLGDPGKLVRGLITAIGAAREGVTDHTAGVGEQGWVDRWRTAGAAALDHPVAAAVLEATDDAPLTEPLVARILGTALDTSSTLVVGASLPIRMLERWAPVVDAPPVVLSNRGANGIDGVVSTAIGVAAAAGAARGRVVGYLGDLTLLYDQGGLAGASRLGLPLQLVVVNNDGGRIFERLPVAGDAGAAFEPMIATPHGLDLAHLASLHGLELHRPTTARDLRSVLALPADTPRLIEVRVGSAAA
ncbi:MAG: 2-succinyl-5-enolpyruvyl-6-hydroxy-3-cyclohexene-1-carboxylic-acid synthase [Solirubrobacteraceae bacterium]